MPLPLGEATGGHGFPGLLGEVPPPLLLWPLAFPEVDGFEPDDPEFGDPFAVPGSVPQGDPLGEPLGLFGVLGLMVDGWVEPPGVGLAGEFEPGTVVFGFPPGEVEAGANLHNLRAELLRTALGGRLRATRDRLKYEFG